MKPAFCIFHNAPGKQPAWHDSDSGLPITHDTQEEAAEEIANVEKELRRQAEAGERDKDDVSWGDWIEPVTVLPDGSVRDQNGTLFGKQDV